MSRDWVSMSTRKGVTKHTWLLLGLVIAPGTLSGGCGLRGEGCPNRDTWCDGSVLMECTRGEGDLLNKADRPYAREDCAKRGGACQEIRSREAQCVVLEEDCDPESYLTLMCRNGDVHACASGYILLDPWESCPSDEPCVETPTRVGCGEGGGAGGAGGMGNNIGSAGASG